MPLENNVFTLKISFLFEEWVAAYDCKEKNKINKELGIICLYKCVKERWYKKCDSY